MDCRKPLTLNGGTFGCGQCLPCRINYRRVWTHRIVLESMKHVENSFVTLTYSPEHLPEGGTLVPSHVQKFLKRFRKAHLAAPVRFYCVGEYGDVSERPHYHLALFGAGMSAANLVREKWGYGLTHTGELTFASAQYIAGYVTKKMTKVDDPRLHGRHPEFSRMSLKPGIGAGAVSDISKMLSGQHGQKIIDNFADVPSVLRHAKKTWPLGRYMIEKLRDEVGWEKTLLAGRRFPSDVKEKKLEKSWLRVLQENERFSSDSRPAWKIRTEEVSQKALNREVRHEIYNGRKI